MSTTNLSANLALSDTLDVSHCVQKHMLMFSLVFFFFEVSALTQTRVEVAFFTINHLFSSQHCFKFVHIPLAIANS